MTPLEFLAWAGAVALGLIVLGLGGGIGVAIVRAAWSSVAKPTPKKGPWVDLPRAPRGQSPSGEKP